MTKASMIQIIKEEVETARVAEQESYKILYEHNSECFNEIMGVFYFKDKELCPEAMRNMWGTFDYRNWNKKFDKLQMLQDLAERLKIEI